MTTSPTGPTSAVERVARHLAARERLGDEARWGETSPEFRDLYRGAAREVIALMQEPAREPGGDRGELRDRIADAIRDAACSGDCGKTEEECAKERIQPFAWHHGRLAVVEGEPEQFADAVLAVLPEPADRAPGFAGRADNGQSARADLLNTFASWLFTTGYGSREAADVILAKHRAEVLREAADQYAKLTDQNEAYDREHGDLNEDARLRYEVVRDVVTGLRRMADETATTETQPESCAHCGQPIRRVTGTLTAWWVHNPGGNTVCHPEQAASSTRATPKTAAGARQDEVQP